MNEKFYNRLKEKIIPYFDKTGSHAFDHTERVYNLCVHLAEEEDVDMDILKVAALMHDIARRKQNESNNKICHAEEGAEIAERILMEMNFPEEKIENVKHCIAVHRYSKYLRAESTEAKILQDADRLDALGAITIARIFDYGGRKNRLMHNPILKIEKYAHNCESNSSLNHFYEKILKIKPETFKMKKAQKIAKGRYEFVNEFVDRFIKEWNGEL